jgi:hypothetical protein
MPSPQAPRAWLDPQTRARSSLFTAPFLLRAPRSVEAQLRPHRGLLFPVWPHVDSLAATLATFGPLGRTSGTITFGIAGHVDQCRVAAGIVKAIGDQVMHPEGLPSFIGAPNGASVSVPSQPRDLVFGGLADAVEVDDVTGDAAGLNGDINDVALGE